MIVPPMAITSAMRAHYHEAARASEELLAEIHRLLYTFEPKTILETGPGLTSILFHQYQQQFSETEYIGLNHSSPFHKIFVDHMEELGFDTSKMFEVELIDDYYDTSQVPPDIKFDFVFLDGPPGSNDRASPEAERFLVNHLHEDSIVIQDDTHRGPEADIAVRLHNYFGLDHHEAKVIQDRTFVHRTSTVLLPKASP